MTKAEERKILEQIVDLIQSTPMDSYIRSAFSGVPEYAVRNIEDDAAYNPVEERDMWEKRYNELKVDFGHEILRFEHENQALQTNLDKATEELTMWKNKWSDTEEALRKEKEASDQFERYLYGEQELSQTKDAEIMRLKAEIYDLRKECEK